MGEPVDQAEEQDANEQLREVDFLLAQVCRRHYMRAHELLETVGLYRGQPPLLSLLSKEAGLTQAELASRLRLAPATVTKSLQRMEKAGFVTRRADAADQRVLRVYLTKEGKAVTEAMRAVLATLAAETLHGLSAVELTQLGALLTRLRHNLDHALGESSVHKY